MDSGSKEEPFIVKQSAPSVEGPLWGDGHEENSDGPTLLVEVSRADKVNQSTRTAVSREIV